MNTAADLFEATYGTLEPDHYIHALNVLVRRPPPFGSGEELIEGPGMRSRVRDSAVVEEGSLRGPATGPKPCSMALGLAPCG